MKFRRVVFAQLIPSLNLLSASWLRSMLLSVWWTESYLLSVDAGLKRTCSVCVAVVLTEDRQDDYLIK